MVSEREWEGSETAGAGEGGSLSTMGQIAEATGRGQTHIQTQSASPANWINQPSELD